MDELTEILQEATRAIESTYFHLNIDGGDPKYRERVYCYELYHQMRLRWPRESPFYLTGEVDKASHPILSDLGAGTAKPDLLVHQPGDMIGNYAIIEVKSQEATDSGIKNDLGKLSLFTREVRYQRAIYLVYGYSVDKVATKVERIYSQENLGPIELWIHQEVGRPARINALRPRREQNQ